MDELKREWHEARRRHPRLVLGVAVVFLLIAVIPAVGGVLVPRRPSRRPARSATRCAASARWIRRRRCSTTRISSRSPSSRSSGSRCRCPQVSPNLDQGAHRRSRISASTTITASISSASRRRRSPTSATAARAQGGSTITQQLARQSFLTPDKTYRRKLQELILAARIERLYTEAADPRAVPQQGVFRRRPLRRRGGVARLLRQARVGADASRRRRCSPAW